MAGDVEIDLELWVIFEAVLKEQFSPHILILAGAKPAQYTAYDFGYELDEEEIGEWMAKESGYWFLQFW